MAQKTDSDPAWLTPAESESAQQTKREKPGMVLHSTTGLGVENRHVVPLLRGTTQSTLFPQKNFPNSFSQFFFFLKFKLK